MKAVNCQKVLLEIAGEYGIEQSLFFVLMALGNCLNRLARKTDPEEFNLMLKEDKVIALTAEYALKLMKAGDEDGVRK